MKIRLFHESYDSVQVILVTNKYYTGFGNTVLSESLSVGELFYGKSLLASLVDDGSVIQLFVCILLFGPSCVDVP